MNIEIIITELRLRKERNENENENNVKKISYGKI
mgnify:CR=1 FL=1